MGLRPDSHRAATLERRDALLAAAIQVVAERGVAGATHREIAKRAGVPLATTSYFFASIDELVHAALRVVVAQLVERLDRLIEEISDPQLSPADVIDRVVPALLQAPEQHVIAQFEVYLEVARRPEWRPEVDRIIEAIERVAETALSAGGAPPVPGYARAVVALVDGLALQRVGRRRRKRDAEALRDALRALFVAHALATPDRREWDRILARRAPAGAQRPLA